MSPSTFRRLRPRPPRRLRLLRPGAFLLVGIFGLGLATLNTGNNLLYLLLGALLGLIVLSGVLSEEALRPLRVTRRSPRRATAGAPARIEYVISHAGSRTPAFALHVGERGWPAAYVGVVEPGAQTSVRHQRTFERRGIIELTTVRLSTAYPFGLFMKSREFDSADRLVVWPRTDRPVPESQPGSAPLARPTATVAPSRVVGRAAYRGLRGYRQGDDPRDVHWRSTARAGELIVREFEGESSDDQWICLDIRGFDGGAAEESAIEIAAALAARAARAGRRFAFLAGNVRVAFGTGSPQLARVLDALAAVRFNAEAMPPVPPPDADSLLVTPRATAAAGFVAVFTGDAE
jgi:uncharacterized protein (DUF58 family)